MPLDTRVASARTVAEVLAGANLDRALAPRLEQVAERDRGLLRQLCFGTVREAPRLQALLEPLLSKTLRAKDRDVLGLLLIGLYQLESTRIPPHAAVSATVAATRGLGKNWARGLVNAVLRRFQREREQLLAALDEPAAAAHPEWLYRRLQSEWPESAADIIAANNAQPPMSLRVNTLRCSREQYLLKLGGAGIDAAPSTLTQEGVRLARPVDVVRLPGFEEGLVSVQDEAAQLAATLLDAAPGERILDACAAPGGKACHILELQPELAELVAADLDPGRLGRVRDNLSRLGLAATLLEADAATPPEQLSPASFDRILVDAPCSASGVIRRHPDVKLLRRPADVAAMADGQLRILAGLWPLLKPGGTLLYATCSIFKEENSGVIDRFLQREAGAQRHPVAAFPQLACGEDRQSLPSPGGPDGLFYARLRKRGD